MKMVLFLTMSCRGESFSRSGDVLELPRRDGVVAREVPEEITVGVRANGPHERQQAGIAFELTGIAEVVVLPLDFQERKAGLMGEEARTNSCFSPSAPDRFD